jgi:hypothetical protein
MKVESKVNARPCTTDTKIATLQTPRAKAKEKQNLEIKDRVQKLEQKGDLRTSVEPKAESSKNDREM